ncbi:hypothetical protein [Pseudomonas sp. RT6P73]
MTFKYLPLPANWIVLRLIDRIHHSFSQLGQQVDQLGLSTQHLRAMTVAAHFTPGGLDQLRQALAGAGRNRVNRQIAIGSCRLAAILPISVFQDFSYNT